MSEHRTETTAAGTVLVLVMLLGGLALLCIVVVVGLGFIASRTTLDRGMEAAMVERDTVLRQQQLADMRLRQAVAAVEEARRQQEQDLAPPAGEPAKPLDFEQMQQAREIAEKYLEHLRLKQGKAARELANPALFADNERPDGIPLSLSLLPSKPPTLVGVKATADSYRFRFQAEFPDSDVTGYFITVGPWGNSYRVEAAELIGSFGFGAPGAMRPPGAAPGSLPQGGPNP